MIPSSNELSDQFHKLVHDEFMFYKRNRGSHSQSHLRIGKYIPTYKNKSWRGWQFIPLLYYDRCGQGTKQGLFKAARAAGARVPL